MRDIFTLFLYAIVTIIRLGKPGGLRCVVAEAVLNATSTPDSESGPKACSQPPVFRSQRRRLMHSTHASDPCSALGNRFETRDSPEFSQNAGQAKVPAPMFTKTSSQTGSQRADEGADRRRRRNETTPSDLGL